MTGEGRRVGEGGGEFKRAESSDLGGYHRRLGAYRQKYPPTSTVASRISFLNDTLSTSTSPLERPNLLDNPSHRPQIHPAVTLSPSPQFYHVENHPTHRRADLGRFHPILHAASSRRVCRRLGRHQNGGRFQR